MTDRLLTRILLKLKSYEPHAYATLFGGLALDQVTTRIGLSIGLMESNPHAWLLIKTGHWLPLDLILASLIILATRLMLILSDTENHESPRLALATMILFPLTAGIIRMGCGVHNLMLILKVMQNAY